MRQLFDHDTWTYTYLLWNEASSEALLIDPVFEHVERDLALLRQLSLKLKYVLETHVHSDYVTGAGVLRRETRAQGGVNGLAGVTCAELALLDGQELLLGGEVLNCIATPGHTDGCMAFYADSRVFTSDTLVVRDVGRTDFQQGSTEKMFHSVRDKLFALPDSTQVFPAHDYGGQKESAIGEEKRWNQKLAEGVSYEDFSARMAAMKLGEAKRIHVAVPANLRCGDLL